MIEPRTPHPVMKRRRRIEKWINRLSAMVPRYGARDHVKLVDLGTHQIQRYVYAHNNNKEHPVEAHIGGVGRGPDGDRLWAMLCAVTQDHRRGIPWEAIKAGLWSGSYDQVGAP